MRSLRSILVTGGAGFIGSHLARHLLAKPELEHLVVLDKLTKTANPNNLIGLDADPRIRLVEGDICDTALVTQLLGEMTATGVFNLAAEPEHAEPTAPPDQFILTNVYGCSRLLEACRTTGVPLLQCSTATVYGSIDSPAKCTEAAPLKPSSPHAASKAAADLLCLSAHLSHGQDLVITRATHTYGPHQHDDAYIPTLVRHAAQGLSLPVPGDGMQIRDWIHVDDHCEGMIATFLRGPAGHVFNYGGHCERTKLGMARSVLGIFGKPESLISNAPDQATPDRRQAVDTAKAENYFAWKPAIPFASAFPSVVRELAANYTSEPPGPPTSTDDETGPDSRWAPPRKGQPPA